MTGRDMLCAIAGIDDGIVLASGQFAAVESSIKADRKRIRQRFTAIGIAAVLSIAVFGAVKSMPQLFNVFRTSDITTIQTPKWDDPNETTATPAVIIPGNTTEEDVGSASSDDQISTTGNGNEHPDTSTEHSIRTEPTSIADRQEPSGQTPQTEAPSTTINAEIPTEPSVEASSVVATTIVNQEEPQSVYQDLIVDYEMAKTYFNLSIAPCYRNDFNGYSVLLVSPNGNINESGTSCLSLTYLFTNGSVTLSDQDMTGEVYPTGNSFSYNGRTFYIHTPEFNGDQIRVKYFPTGNSGIAYQTFFGSNTNVNDIMDLIISLEI